MENDTLTDEQLSGISVLLHMALKEIRLLGWDGKAEQAAELADALCQLPLRMHSTEPRLASLETHLGWYQQQYPNREPAIDYVSSLRYIQGLRAKA